MGSREPTAIYGAARARIVACTTPYVSKILPKMVHVPVYDCASIGYALMVVWTASIQSIQAHPYNPYRGDPYNPYSCAAEIWVERRTCQRAKQPRAGHDGGGRHQSLASQTGYSAAGRGVRNKSYSRKNFGNHTVPKWENACTTKAQRTRGKTKPKQLRIRRVVEASQSGQRLLLITTSKSWNEKVPEYGGTHQVS